MHYQGIGLLLGCNAEKAPCEWDPMDELLLYARLKSNHSNISLFVCYASTNDAPDERKDSFYGKLQEGTGRVARHDVLICIGDFNAIMGCSNEGLEACTGKMGVGGRMCENGGRFGSFRLANDGGMSEIGLRFGSFCLANDSVIGGTLFQHQNIHKATWVSPCGKCKNQIDSIAVSKRHRSFLLDVRVNRGADIGSDHHLNVAKIRLKLKSQKKRKPVVDRYDTDMLRREGRNLE